MCFDLAALDTARESKPSLFSPNRNSIRNGVWPTSTNNLGVACGFSLYLLEYEPASGQAVTAYLKRAVDALPLPISE